MAGLENLAIGTHYSPVHECFYWSSWFGHSYCQVEFFSSFHLYKFSVFSSSFFRNLFVYHNFWVCLSSHFSLLLGCALPIWMSSGLNDRPLAPFAGILSLGIGDTMVKNLLHIITIYFLWHCIIHVYVCL